MKNEVINEAIRRLNILNKDYGLSRSVINYYEEGEVYYSYLTAGGLIPSIDTIKYDPLYEKIMRKFERRTGFTVYHCIEAFTYGGKTLSLLYVKPDYKECPADEWRYGNYLAAYVVTLTKNGAAEYGDILVGASDPLGALVRKG